MSKEYPRARGAFADPFSDKDFRYKLAGATIFDLPDLIDNREYCTEVGDQQTEGTCVGWTIKKAVEMLLWRENGQKLDLSARWAYEKAKEHDAFPGTKYNGTSLRGGLDALIKEGICREQKWPYEEWAPGVPQPLAHKDAKKRKDFEFNRIFVHNHVRHAIHKHGQVLVTGAVHTGWKTPKDDVIQWNKNYNADDYHAYLLVGYDNNKGLYLVDNHWSVEWGDCGFAWMKFDDFIANRVDIWSLELKGG